MSCHNIGHGLNEVVRKVLEEYDAGLIPYESAFHILQQCAKSVYWGDAVMERVENGESPILIRSAGTTDLLLFGWEDYLRRFPTLYTPGEIAEIKAVCLEIKETEAE